MPPMPHSTPTATIAGSVTPEEAAAIAAALERFAHETAPPPAVGPGEAPEGWARAAMLEGVARENDADFAHPWINT